MRWDRFFTVLAGTDKLHESRAMTHQRIKMLMMRHVFRQVALAACCCAALVVSASGQQKAAGEQKTAPGSSSEAVLAYREAANFQNNGAFEIAAEEWQKFLKNYGQDP